MGYGPYFDSSEDSWAAIGSKLSLPQYAAGNNEASGDVYTIGGGDTNVASNQYAT